MVAKKKPVKAVASKTAAKAKVTKAKVKVKAAPAAKKETKPKDSAIADLDRKGMAARARQLKTELLAIRFNLQAPNLKDYRKKKKELATVLSQLA